MRMPRELAFTRPSPISENDFVALIRARPRDEVLLGIRSTQTVEGAQRLYWAERIGRNRAVILRAAARRVAELGGEEPERMAPALIIAATAAELPKGRRHG
jgi:hypothetical protein